MNLIEKSTLYTFILFLKPETNIKQILTFTET